MEQNLFTEGVRPGSVTTPEEVHMLICYIFREAGQPVTLDQANEVLQRQSLVNYFEFAEAAERLIRMGHLRPAENGRYTLSPEGEKLADTFRQKLPAAVRERAQRALDDVLTLLRRQQENKVRVKKVGDGCEITLTITDIGSDLMSLTLFLPTEKECEQVRRRFLNDPALLYKGTMALLTGDMETFGENINLSTAKKKKKGRFAGISERTFFTGKKSFPVGFSPRPNKSRAFRPHRSNRGAGLYFLPIM